MMTMRVSVRGAVCAAVLILVLAFAGAATARAQGAAGAGARSSPTAEPAPHAQPGQTSGANSNSPPDAANSRAHVTISGGGLRDIYEPITGEQRLDWLAKSTLYPNSLLAGLFSAAIGTGLNHPREDGPHWGGFGERYGIRLTGIATSDTMEVGLGAIWGEDPRYKREPGEAIRWAPRQCDRAGVHDAAPRRAFRARLCALSQPSAGAIFFRTRGAPIARPIARMQDIGSAWDLQAKSAAMPGMNSGPASARTFFTNIKTTSKPP